MKHKVRIVQSFRVEREIIVEVEAVDQDSAVEEIQSGNIWAPPFLDPRWKTGWDLQNEEAMPA